MYQYFLTWFLSVRFYELILRRLNGICVYRIILMLGNLNIIDVGMFVFYFRGVIGIIIKIILKDGLEETQLVFSFLRYVEIERLMRNCFLVLLSRFFIYGRLYGLCLIFICYINFFVFCFCYYNRREIIFYFF